MTPTRIFPIRYQAWRCNTSQVRIFSHACGTCVHVQYYPTTLTAGLQPCSYAYRCFCNNYNYHYNYITHNMVTLNLLNKGTVGFTTPRASVAAPSPPAYRWTAATAGCSCRSCVTAGQQGARAIRTRWPRLPPQAVGSSAGSVHLAPHAGEYLQSGGPAGEQTKSRKGSVWPTAGKCE